MRNRLSLVIAAAAIVCQAWAMDPAAAEVVVSVDVFAQQMTVTVDGMRRYNWPVSTGREGYATPAGSFRALRLAREHFSREWDNAPMPYSIFFTARGHAIHGTRSTAALGSPASHGCVRLAATDAARLFALVEEHGLADTRVEIVGGVIAPEALITTSAAGTRPYRVDIDRLIRLLDGG